MTICRAQDRLCELAMPTLPVWGAQDRILPAAHAYTASELIPSYQLHIFEECGHSVHKQRAEEFSHLLANLLD